MGADYDPANKAIIQYHSRVAVAPNSTLYLAACEVLNSEVAARTPVPVAGVLLNLTVNSRVPPGAGETYTYTIMINGIASVITCQIAGAVDENADSGALMATVVQGDLLSLQVVTSLNAAENTQKASLLLR